MKPSAPSVNLAIRMTGFLAMALLCAIGPAQARKEGHGGGNGIVSKRGHGGGNAGGVLICKNAEGSESAKPHDIYEGEQLGLTFREAYASSTSALRQHLVKRLTSTPDELTLYLQAKTKLISYLSRKTWENSEESPEIMTEDIWSEVENGDFVVPDGCRLRNAFRYVESAGQKSTWQVEMEPETMKLLAHFGHDRVILDQHEILYRLARIRIGDRISKRIRVLLAYAASDQARVAGSEAERKFLALRQEFWSLARPDLTCPPQPVSAPARSSKPSACNQSFKTDWGNLLLIPGEDGYVTAYIEVITSRGRIGGGSSAGGLELPSKKHYYPLTGRCVIQADGGAEVLFQSPTFEHRNCGYRMEGRIRDGKFTGKIVRHRAEIGAEDTRLEIYEGVWHSQGTSQP